MIKNLLYSLFLHFLLFLCIYANFSQKKIEETKNNEVAVSLISISGIENSTNKKQELSQNKVLKEKNNTTTTVAKTKQTPKKKSKENQAKSKIKKNKNSKSKENLEKAPANKNPDKVKDLKNYQESSKKISSSPTEDLPEKDSEDETFVKSDKTKDLGKEQKIEEDVSDKEVVNNAATESEAMPENVEAVDLSAREKLNMQSQLKRCYNRALEEASLKNTLSIVIKAKISDDGYISSNLNSLIDDERYNDPQESDYKLAIDVASRALDLCSPLRNLPLDKYDAWRDIIINFGEND